jgi:hypothetical protein
MSSNNASSEMIASKPPSEPTLSAEDKRHRAISRTPWRKEGDNLLLWLSFSPPPDDKYCLMHDVIVKVSSCEQAWSIACAYQALHYLDVPIPPPYTSRPHKPDSNMVMLNMHMIAATKDYQIALLSGIESPNMEDWVDMGYKNWSDSTIAPKVFSAKEYQEAIQEVLDEKGKWWKEHAHCTKGSCSCIL